MKLITLMIIAAFGMHFQIKLCVHLNYKDDFLVLSALLLRCYCAVYGQSDLVLLRPCGQNLIRIPVTLFIILTKQSQWRQYLISFLYYFLCLILCLRKMYRKIMKVGKQHSYWGEGG